MCSLRSRAWPNASVGLATGLLRASVAERVRQQAATSAPLSALRLRPPPSPVGNRIAELLLEEMVGAAPEEHPNLNIIKAVAAARCPAAAAGERPFSTSLLSRDTCGAAGLPGNGLPLCWL